MFGLFRKTQMISLILPYTLDFFSVRGEDGGAAYYEIKGKNQIYYQNPEIKITSRVRKIFEICDCSVNLKLEHPPKDRSRHLIEFSDELWKTTSLNRKQEVLAASVIRNRQPYLLVPADRIIELETAIDHLKNEIEEEKNV